LPVLLPLLLGAGLFVFSGTITRRVTGSAPGQGAWSDAALVRIESIAYAVLGRYLLVQAVSDAVFLLTKLQLFSQHAQSQGLFLSPSHGWPEDFAQAWARSAQFLLGLLLLLGGSGLAAIRHKLVGTPIK
jgi:hypothetical protein